MLVECKSAKTKLNSNHLNQLLRYYSVSDCRIGVLTNGVEYRFFTDSVNAGRMDMEPFLIVDIINDDLTILESLMHIPLVFLENGMYNKVKFGSFDKTTDVMSIDSLGFKPHFSLNLMASVFNCLSLFKLIIHFTC